MTRRRVAVLLALAIILLGALSVGLFGGGSPTLLAPAPIPHVLLMFSGIPMFASVLVPALLFVIWNPRPFTARPEGSSLAFPKRTWALLAALAAGSVAWYVAGWNLGVTYEGFRYTAFCAGVSAVYFALSFVTATIATRRRNANANIASHFFIFAWLSTYAFPWFGEVI